MSTLKVNRIENTSTTDGGVSIDVDGHVTIDGQQLPTAGPLSNRNLIINGAMQFAQRGISANNITSTSAYRTVDRYKQFINTLGTWTVERHASGPPGFDYSYRATCTSGNASPAAGSYAFIRYGVEKQDMQRLAWATTGAKEFTLSFWVKSNRTGTASLTILYSDGNLRGMTKTYTIDAANTWEHKSLTFPANGLSESSEADNGVGFWIEWWLNSGSTFTGGSANTDWANLNDNQRNPTNFGLGSVDDQEFHLTGVQLEVGSKATPFEHESYSQTLAKCMRYFQIIDGTVAGGALVIGNGSTRSANNSHIQIPLGIALRDKPAASVTNTVRIIQGGNSETGSSNSTTVGGTTPSVHTDNTNFNVTLNYNGNIGYSIAANTGGISMQLNTPGTFRLDSEL